MRHLANDCGANLDFPLIVLLQVMFSTDHFRRQRRIFWMNCAPRPVLVTTWFGQTSTHSIGRVDGRFSSGFDHTSRELLATDDDLEPFQQVNEPTRIAYLQASIFHFCS